MTDKTVLQLWLTKFPNLHTIKGLNTDFFDPLELFQKENRHVRNVHWTLKDNNQDLRNKTLDYLRWNQADFLKLSGGSVDKVDIPTIHSESIRHLQLKHMPNIGLNEVFNKLT